MEQIEHHVFIRNSRLLLCKDNEQDKMELAPSFFNGYFDLHVFDWLNQSALYNNAYNCYYDIVLPARSIALLIVKIM